MVISIFIDTGGGGGGVVYINQNQHFKDTPHQSVAAKPNPVCFWPLTMREVQSKPGAIQPFPFLYNFHFTAL